jgi:hypothetical protein
MTGYFKQKPSRLNTPPSPGGTRHTKTILGRKREKKDISSSEAKFKYIHRQYYFSVIPVSQPLGRKKKRANPRENWK